LRRTTEHTLSRLRLTINSDLKDVVFVGLAVNKICEHLQMSAVDAYRMELCAVEAVTNSIRHAYRNQPGNEVSVTLVIRDNRLEVEVADSGLAMLATQVARLSEGSSVLEFDPTDRESLPEGGMGLQIMHEVMDEISYISDGQVNLLRLTRVLDEANEAEARHATTYEGKANE
jgi:serine/threonine-protein kinase RsbW